MNTKTKFLAIGIGALTALNFSSCSDYSEFTEAEIKHDVKMKEFYDNFVKEFGEPDPNHTWGWEGMTPELADAILGENGTRASYNPGHDPETQPGYVFNPDADNESGRILINRNQWAEQEGSTGEYKSYAIARMAHIPGWPNEDNQYIAEGPTTSSNGKVFGTPKGDISEYEIQYVSWWMRNHPYDPGSSEQSHLDLVDLHVSEFFIQQVSHDADYSDYTNLATTERNLSEVGGGGWGMDYLHFKALDGNWTHINNFNASQNSKPWNNLGNNNTRTIQYVMSSGTEDFNYHSSTSTNSYTFDKWVMVKIEWDEPRNPDWSQCTDQASLETYLASPKSDTFHRVGYYLCFDFQADKSDNNKTHPEMDYPGDNHFSNWILKITPGKQVQIGRWPKRLMCEDLGNTYDFDFNDAVFDLFFQENANTTGSYDCIVTLQAAGGTMPIWVAVNPDDISDAEAKKAWEIHELLGGYPAKTPVNVIKGGATAPFASYRVKNMFNIADPQSMYVKDSDGNWVANTSYNQTELLMTKMAAAAFKLNIYVQTPSGILHVSGYDIYKSLRNGSNTTDPAYQDGYNDGIKATNYAPQLFNCSVDAKWTYENGHIKDAYKHFIDWVHQEQGAYRLRWDKDGYYERHFESDGNVTASKVDNDINTWLGSWDFGPKDATEWGTDGDWIDKSKCWGGNGPE